MMVRTVTSESVIQNQHAFQQWWPRFQKLSVVKWSAQWLCAPFLLSIRLMLLLDSLSSLHGIIKNRWMYVKDPLMKIPLKIVHKNRQIMWNLKFFVRANLMNEWSRFIVDISVRYLDLLHNFTSLTVFYSETAKQW